MDSFSGNIVRTYYLLTKPGIIMGNLITTVSGFALASPGRFDLFLLFNTLLGLGAIIASACVFNNYIDRNLDRKMERTKQRALPRGLISGKKALFFACSLGIFGAFILSLYTHFLALWTAAFGFFIYVALYSFWKSKTPYATAVGSVAGAIPPVVGYCAASHQFDWGAALLFMILVFWQMPHFFSIAMYRMDEYKQAAIPVFPLRKGSDPTKRRILLYVIAFTLSCFLLIALGYTSWWHLISSALLGGGWIFLSVKGFKTDNDVVWARTMFRFSLLVITFFCFSISIDSFFKEAL